jgi:hypothetical protein
MPIGEAATARIPESRRDTVIVWRKRLDRLMRRCSSAEAESPRRLPNKYANTELHVVVAFGAFLLRVPRKPSAKPVTAII